MLTGWDGVFLIAGGCIQHLCDRSVVRHGARLGHAFGVNEYFVCEHIAWRSSRGAHILKVIRDGSDGHTRQAVVPLIRRHGLLLCCGRDSLCLQVVVATTSNAFDCFRAVVVAFRDRVGFTFFDVGVNSALIVDGINFRRQIVQLIRARTKAKRDHLGADGVACSLQSGNLGLCTHKLTPYNVASKALILPTTAYTAEDVIGFVLSCSTAFAVSTASVFVLASSISPLPI